MGYRKDLARIIKYKGKQHQLTKAVEELNELGVALTKYINLPNADYRAAVTEEMADVEIMIEQLKIMLYNRDEVARIRQAKVIRTLKRLGITRETKMPKAVCGINNLPCIWCNGGCEHRKEDEKE